MAGIEQSQEGPIKIAPAPPGATSINANANGDSEHSKMLYACQQCASRKIKCDKIAPICSSCRKGRLECIYQAPPPRRRKRKLSGDGSERLARYERILRQHDLLPQEDDVYLSNEATPQEAISLRYLDSQSSRNGKLLASQGKSRYISSNLWQNLGEDEMHQMSEDEDEDQHFVSTDPLTGAFVGYQINLHQYHPTDLEAMVLWKAHTENVEPLCKILHIPSTFEMIQNVTPHPEIASKTEECLLFAIYHFAVFSMTDEECETNFRSTRDSVSSQNSSEKIAELHYRREAEDHLSGLEPCFLAPANSSCLIFSFYNRITSQPGKRLLTHLS